MTIPVGYVFQNTQGALSFAWHEWLSCESKEWNICTAASSRWLGISNMNILRRRLADYVKIFSKKRAARAARLFLPM